MTFHDQIDFPMKALHKDAEPKPKSLGSGLLSKTSATKMKGNFYIYKEKSKGRKKLKEKIIIIHFKQTPLKRIVFYLF